MRRTLRRGLSAACFDGDKNLGVPGAPTASSGPLVPLTFDSVRSLSEWYRTAAVAGVIPLSLPGLRATDGMTVDLEIHVTGEGVFGARAVVTPHDTNDGTPLCTLWPRADLQSLLARFHLSERGQRKGQPTGDRRAARFDTFLNAVFRSQQQLVGEYVNNISTGGMFVRTERPLQVGTDVIVDVTFPGRETFCAQARVVRRVSPEQAAATGQIPGVGLELVEAAAFTDAVEQLVSSFLTRARRVLVADDDRFILHTVCDGLMVRGMEVVVAPSGAHASKKLMDLFYELDAVVLDLHMPGVEGAVLIQRLRRMRREMDLRLVVLSGDSAESLQHLIGPDGADAAISKQQPMEQIIDRVYAAVSR